MATSTGATTMHMQIVETGVDTHNFIWDNTPWRVDQGGTGASNFAPGALIYGNGPFPLATTEAGTLGYVLQFNGAIPTWVATSTLGIVAQVAGSNGEIQFNSNGKFGSDPNFSYDANTGRLLVGTTSVTNASSQWEFVSQKPSGNLVNVFSITNYSTEGTPFPILALRSVRGSAMSPSAVLSGDFLGQIRFIGYDGESIIGGGANSPMIYGSARENWTSTSHGSAITFGTVPLGTTARVDRVQIQPNGDMFFFNDGKQRTLFYAPSSDNSASPIFTIQGSNNTGTGNGGILLIQGGNGAGGNGGDIHLKPGVSLSGGIPGKIVFINPLNPSNSMHFNVSNLTAFRNTQFQDTSGTLGLLEANQVWSGQNTFSIGSATTTVNFGELGNVNSHACFNTKNTDGADISFYFVGTTMVIEPNTCN